MSTFVGCRGPPLSVSNCLFSKFETEENQVKKSLITITYTLANGHSIQIDVSPEVAAVLDETERKTLALLKQDKRHLHLYGYVEGESESSLSYQQEDVADLITRLEEYDRLRHAIYQLTEPQRRRIKAYFFSGLSVEKIAAIEGVCHQSVSESIRSALKKLRSLMN